MSCGRNIRDEEKYIAGQKFAPDQLGYKLKIIPPG
jgi:hypothetical protein